MDQETEIELFNQGWDTADRELRDSYNGGVQDGIDEAILKGLLEGVSGENKDAPHSSAPNSSSESHSMKGVAIVAGVAVAAAAVVGIGIEAVKNKKFRERIRGIFKDFYHDFIGD
jgi:hypothetical protein